MFWTIVGAILFVTFGIPLILLAVVIGGGYAIKIIKYLWNNNEVTQREQKIWDIIVPILVIGTIMLALLH